MAKAKETVKDSNNVVNETLNTTLTVNNIPDGIAYAIVKDLKSNMYKIVEVKFNLGSNNVTELDEQMSKAAAVESFKINVAKSGMLN